MKTISKIIFTCVFLFVSILILSVPTEVSAYIMPKEDDGGGSTSNPLPPVEPVPVINFVTNLNKTSFAPGETITLSGSILRNACANSTVNMKSEAYIVKPVAEGDERYQLYNSLLAGGTSVPFSQDYKAPLTNGSYIMYAKATTYSAGYFWVEIEGYYYARFTLNELITLLEPNYNYSAGPRQFVDINDSTKTYNVTEVPAGTKVLNNIENQITITVATVTVTPKTVNVEAIRKCIDSSLINCDSVNPIPKSAQNVTTKPITPNEAIKINWRATGFNSNVICKVPPNNNAEPVGRTSGSIDYSTGPSGTTTYSVTCNDDVITAPVSNPTKTLPNVCGTKDVTGECRDYTTGNVTAYCSEARFSTENACNAEQKCRWLYCAL